MECAEVCDGMLRCVVSGELLRCTQVYRCIVSCVDVCAGI